jgi:general secretion pathway protein I
MRLLRAKAAESLLAAVKAGGLSSRPLAGRTSDARLPTNRRLLTRRSGLTLFEVIVSLAIFLFALTAVSQLMSLSTGNVLDASVRGEAALLCQSKMAEYMAGSVQSSDSGDYDGANKGFSWTITSTDDPSGLTGLMTIEVTVSKEIPNHGTVAVSLSQMVYNPALKGSTTDLPIPAIATAPSSSGQ